VRINVQYRSESSEQEKKDEKKAEKKTRVVGLIELVSQN